MALNSANVRAAITGAVYVGPTGVTAPTSHSSVLPGTLKDLGYLSEDGITEARSRSTENIIGWQNAAVVRTAVTEAGITFTFTPIETNKVTVETFYGSAVNDSTGLITINPANTGGRKSWVIDVIDGDAFIRTFIAEGEVTEVDEKVYANGEPIGYPLTVTAYTQPLQWTSTLIAA